MKVRNLFFAAASVCAVPWLVSAQTRIELFNGRDLSGWVRRGGHALYTVEKGEIVGHSVVDTPNSFLCTEKTYGDFVLEFEFKVDPRLNSGVQFRSSVFDHDTEFSSGGKVIKIPADRVHGYQCEIDVAPKRDRWWSAGVYDEARRGWLFPSAASGDAAVFTVQGRSLSRVGDWNRVRIEAVGDSIKTWLNDEPRAVLIDAASARGFIALQVHDIGKAGDQAGSEVRWRNIVLTDLSPPADAAASNTLSADEKAAGWRLLWDGVSTDGWRSAKAETFPAGGWTLRDGLLSVVSSGGAESRNGGDIITRERFSEFELSVDFKISRGANSGIKYFVQPGLPAIDGSGKVTGVGSSIGLEYQILDDLVHPDAKLGRDGNRTLGSLYDLLTASADKKPNPVGEWNTARILVAGSRVEHWLNGVRVLAYERGTPAFHGAIAASKYKNIPGFGEWSEGHILLQDHGDAVSYRNIKIRVPAKP